MKPDAEDSTGGRYRKRVPLAPRQTRQLLSDVERAKKDASEQRSEIEEETRAALYSSPVRLLGLLMAGGAVFDLFAGIQGYGDRLGGILSFFVGLFVLKGSQIALRVASLLLILLATATIAKITWACWHGHPFEAGNKWVDLASLPFLAFVVSPCVYLIAESILSISALRLRKFQFWTKWTRILIAIIVVAGAGWLTRDLVRQNEVRRDFSGELSKIRSWILSTAAAPSPAAKDPQLNLALENSRSIEKVLWKDRPASFMPTYKRDLPGSPRGTGKPYLYSEWIRLSSGQWGKLEIEVILPKAP
ncbi:hypothetical protein OKA04_16935 [Luteolibacter flavescens]|uniref:Yip1 domain-containing protein n=1 Tax=Luteolibacter flavescens TaxID=1859460 RepID=A0ABT3FS65_9BACT|nr:hypothetical protein [Luteolibacter flavescens]MCW1886426.1 hypothetical protein [Luteolibacter flavescens]